MNATERFNRARITYNYCGVCGRRPKSNEEPNRAPLRWWDCDDGWKVGSLCRWCAEECLDDLPKPKDYAYSDRDGQSLANVDTDEDPLLAF